ncbi:MAG TPA: hypothetical protein VF618_01035 [Thermoanaerobaculia bacterium]
MSRLLMIPLALLLALPRPAQALETDELLALVTLPLAVAAVADEEGVPALELANLVATLNNAGVEPARMIEVVRYVPVALVAEAPEAPFVGFVEASVAQGLRSDALVNVIEDRLRSYDLPDVQLNVQQARLITDIREDEHFVVRRRGVRRTAPVVEHPHGGPPGQLKKERGEQTGAAIVHGITRQDVDEVRKAERKAERKLDRKADRGGKKLKAKVDRADNSGKGNGRDNGNGKGNGGGKKEKGR